MIVKKKIKMVEPVFLGPEDEIRGFKINQTITVYGSIYGESDGMIACVLVDEKNYNRISEGDELCLP